LTTTVNQLCLKCLVVTTKRPSSVRELSVWPVILRSVCHTADCNCPLPASVAITASKASCTRARSVGGNCEDFSRNSFHRPTSASASVMSLATTSARKLRIQLSSLAAGRVSSLYSPAHVGICTCEVHIALSKSIKDRDTTIWAGTGLRLPATIDIYDAFRWPGSAEQAVTPPQGDSHPR